MRRVANLLSVLVAGCGCGFALNPSLGHWGLKGMQERTKRIGGQLEVWSERGAGTEVQLILPVSKASADGGGRGSRLRRKAAKS